MAVLVQITGEPGTGKTYSIKTLDPKTSYYIDADGRGLAWAGWRDSYNSELKNYAKLSDPKQIATVLTTISEKRPDVKVAIVDTINTIMTDKEHNDRKKPGFDEDHCRIKISLIAGTFHSIMNTPFYDGNIHSPLKITLEVW